MDENESEILRQNEEELALAEKKIRSRRRLKILLGAAVAVPVGCLFGGMFAGLNWLVFTGLGIMVGVTLLASLAVVGKYYVKSAKNNVEKYGGSLKPYIYKGITLLAAISAAVVFGVLGFVLSEFYIIGTIVSFFAFVLIFFAWQP